MKKNKFFIPVALVFIFAFLYLHQKVQIYAAAYKLSRNCEIYNNLVDRRDYLMYNFAKEISLPKVNQWAENNNFLPVGKDRMIALNMKGEKVAGTGKKVASLLNRFLGISTPTEAMAEEKR